MPFNATASSRRGSGSSSNRSSSPMSARSDDSSSTGSRRGRAAGILRSLRGSRNSNSKQKDKHKSVLDVFQNIRLRAASDRHERDDATAATSLTPSLASTQNSSLGSGPFQRASHLPYSRTPTQQMRPQDHAIPSLTSSWNTSPVPSLAGISDRTRSRKLSLKMDGTKRFRADSTSSYTLSPLYNAVSAGAPRHVVQSLLEGNQTTSLPTGGSMTALHCAIERYDTQVDVLLLILASDPNAARVRCADNHTCVDLIWKRFVDPAEYRSEVIKAKALSLRRIMEGVVDSPFIMHRQIRAEHAIQESNELKEFWDTIVLFIKAATNHIPGTCAGREKPLQLLHDCIELDCDPLLIRFAAALYPDQVRDMVNDERYLPLHLAATKASPSVLKCVLPLFPQAASRPDADGRLPLHHALAHGMKWDDGIEELIKTFPRSFTLPDPKTGLPPVLQAASSTDDLTTVFNMLATNPMFLMNYALQEEQ